MTIKVTGAYFPERETNFYTGEGTAISLLSVSQYHQFVQEGSAPNIENNEGILLKRGQLESVQGSLPEPEKLYLAGRELPISVTGVAQDILGGDRSVRYTTPLLLLNDHDYEEIKVSFTYPLAYFTETGLANTFSQQVNDGASVSHYQLTDNFKWQNQQVTGKASEKLFAGERAKLGNGYWRETVFDKRPFLASTRQTYGLVVYIAVFLGIVFLVATASIITVKQLAEFSQGRERYRLLLKLGVNPQKIKESIFAQNAVVFFSPLLIGSFHAYFAIAALKSLLNGQGQFLIWLLSLSFLGIYSLFYYVTSRSCYRLIMK